MRSKVPYYNEDDDSVHYHDGEAETKDGIYIAMASFITSYARLKTITSAQRVMDNNAKKISKAQFVYADTDSLHIVLNGETPEEFFAHCGLEIDKTKLGAWDWEASFTKAKFLRQKCYIENHIITEEEYQKGINGESSALYSSDENGYCGIKVTVAGMPKQCHNQVTFKNFKIGATYTGKIQPKIVPGGVVLKDVEFTIKD